jgi:hypothetical protein
MSASPSHVALQAAGARLEQAKGEVGAQHTNY